MINETFLVPANSKKSQLIFGAFRKIDLIIGIIGASLTILLLVLIPISGIGTIILTLLPILVAGALIFPIPNYHNLRVLLKEILEFYKNRRKYVWRGWCYKYEQSDK